jgi:hypothetical protein
MMMAKTMIDASKNLVAAKPIGGKSWRPILIKIHVEPHIRQRISQTKTLIDRFGIVFYCVSS